jgi:hypothetical protein
MEDYKADVFDFLDSLSPYLSLLTTILNAVFGGFLGLSAVLIFVGAIMFFFNKPKLRIILHLCWMLFTLITFIGLTISIILFGLNLFGFQFCDYFGYRVFKWDDPAYAPTTNPEWETLNDKLLKLTGTTEDLATACFVQVKNIPKIKKKPEIN